MTEFMSFVIGCLVGGYFYYAVFLGDEENE